MALTVLSDEAIQSILASLTQEETLNILENLAQALAQYSVNEETAGYASRYQPQRTGVTSPNGHLTLFMPFTSTSTIGTKIINLEATSSASSSGRPAPPKGVVTLLDASGSTTGLLNAEGLTAFRTSLASMILFKDRKRVSQIIVFGAGSQALWHIRLALILRGGEIESVTIVNRSIGRAKEMMTTLAQDDHSRWGGSRVHFEALDPEQEGYWGQLEERLAVADVVFCCTPSSKPLFPADLLVKEGKLEKGCYITAIGSHSADMVELDPAIFTSVVNGPGPHPLGKKGGAIVVDSRRSCLLEAGEIIQGKIQGESLVDVGELVALDEEKKEAAREWVEGGFVIYKCVGIAVMDAAVASCLVDLAKNKSVGVSISDF